MTCTTRCATPSRNCPPMSGSRAAEAGLPVQRVRSPEDARAMTDLRGEQPRGRTRVQRRRGRTIRRRGRTTGPRSTSTRLSRVAKRVSSGWRLADIEERSRHGRVEDAIALDLVVQVLQAVAVAVHGEVRDGPDHLAKEE